jgi:hypothetical protein
MIELGHDMKFIVDGGWLVNKRKEGREWMEDVATGTKGWGGEERGPKLKAS